MRKAVRRWADQDLTISQRRLLYLGKALDEHCRMNRVEGDFRMKVMELANMLSKKAREDAARTLRKEYGEDKRSLKPLLWAALNEPNLESRREIYFNLALHPHNVLAVKEMREVARTHPNEDVCSYAVGVLADCRDRHSIPLFEKGLDSDNQKLRWESAMALAILGERKRKKEVYENIEEVLRSEESSQRIWAAWSLQGLNEERSISLLVKALADKNATVRTQAATSLGDLKSKKTYPDLMRLVNDKEKRVYVEALKSLVKFDGQAKRLREDLCQKIPSTRSAERKAAMAEALGRLLGKMAKKRASGARAKKINTAEKVFTGTLSDWQQGYIFFEIVTNPQLARRLPTSLTVKGQREKIDFLQNLKHQAKRDPAEIAEIFGHVKPGKKTLRSKLWQLLKRKKK